QGEWRHRLENGQYTVRMAAIEQLDKDFFLRNGGPATPGYRDFRGSFESNGKFNLSTNWVWGWDALLVTDPTFFQDYKISTLQSQRNPDPVGAGLTEGISQLYLTGRGERSYFDVRTMYFYGFSEQDLQNQIPVVLPVLDYSKVIDQPVFGGELGYKVNFTG